MLEDVRQRLNLPAIGPCSYLAAVVDLGLTWKSPDAHYSIRTCPAGNKNLPHFQFPGHDTWECDGRDRNCETI